jgi:hypothetical protein
VGEEGHRESDDRHHDEDHRELRDPGGEDAAEGSRERLVDRRSNLDLVPHRCRPDRGAEAGESLCAKLRG